jgi:hypothetical protein
MWLFKAWINGKLESEQWCVSLNLALNKARLYEKEYNARVEVWLVHDDSKRTLAYP